jgi:nicotinamide-nucleotide amidase
VPEGRTPSELAVRVVARLTERGQTLAVAESLTGGLLAAAVVDVPGASAVLRGGVVAYATDLKHDLLGVDADLLAREGAVHPEVAAQMATGVRTRLGATWGLATTGVAGPEPQDGRAPGTVHVAVAGPDGVRTADLSLPGARAHVRAATVDAALTLLLG